MGIFFSCPFSKYSDVDTGLESVVVKSISFGDDEAKTPVRLISFGGQGFEPAISKSLGSGKMVVERSVCFKCGELEIMISIRASPPDKEKDASTRPVSINSKEMDNQPLLSDDSTERIRKPTFFNPQSPKHVLAVKLPVYKSLRTRRKLADCAVLAEQSWSKLLDFVQLKKSSISFFDIEKHESAISRWSRARTRAAKVGKGLSKNDKAQKLSLPHWLEAIDPRHRYGHNLRFYYLQWFESKSREPFFYWLDIGEGKEANVEKCPRSKLKQQCIKYLGPMERKTYEVVVKEGKLLYKESGELLHSTKDAKWIFVLSTSKSLYVGKKMKGKFQHSSFLAGGVATAAGRLEVDGGVLKAVWPHSGHYRPTEESFKDFLSFLRENNVDLTDVKLTSPMDEEDRVPYKQGSYKHRRNNSSDEDLSHAVNDLEIEEVQNLTPENTFSVDEKTSSVLEQQKPRQLINFGRKLTNLKESERSGLVERLNSTEKLFSESCRTRPRCRAEHSKNEVFKKTDDLFLTICDAAEPWQLGFQDAASPMMQGIMDLHHDILFFLILILVFVLWILVGAYGISTIKRIQSRNGLFMELLSRLFGSFFLVSSLCSLLYHHLLSYSQWTM